MGMKKNPASPLELSRNLETYENVKYLLKKKINKKKDKCTNTKNIT